MAHGMLCQRRYGEAWVDAQVGRDIAAIADIKPLIIKQSVVLIDHAICC